MVKQPPAGYKTALQIAYELGIERQKVYDIAKFFKVDKFHNGSLSRATPRIFYPFSEIQQINQMLKTMTYKEVKKRLKG